MNNAAKRGGQGGESLYLTLLRGGGGSRRSINCPNDFVGGRSRQKDRTKVLQNKTKKAVPDGLISAILPFTIFNYKMGVDT